MNNRDKKLRQKSRPYRKHLAAGTAVSLAVVAGVGSILSTALSVQASPAMMPGIETIVGETSSQEPFRILEIVDEKKEAEIGWYVSGQEPYVKLYEYTYTEKDENGQEQQKILHFSTLEEGLAMLPTKEQREEFAGNFTYKRNQDGSYAVDENGHKIIADSALKNVQEFCYQGNAGKEEDYPISYRPYEEKYFLDKEDKEEEWKLVEFSQVREDRLKGTYVENTSGTGDYTREAQMYFPVRNDHLSEEGTKLDIQANSSRLYRENITGFLPSESEQETGGGTAPYHLEFQEIANTEFNENLKKLLDPSTSNEENPIKTAYDHTVRTDTNTDGKIDYRDAYGYGYYENKYEALTREMMDQILPSDGSAPKYMFPGENPIMGSQIGITGVSSSNAVKIKRMTYQVPEGSIDVVPSETPEGDMDAVPSEMPEAEEQPPIQNQEFQLAPQIINSDTAGTQQNPYVYLAESIAAYPHYSYEKVGDLEYIKQQAKPYVENYIPSMAGEITISREGQYLYWIPGENPGDWNYQELFVVTGRQPVAYENLRQIAEECTGNYYYRVTEIAFCAEKTAPAEGSELKPENYRFYGWYYPSYPENEERYLAVSPEAFLEATYYISEAEYEFTPGTGDHDFVPSEAGQEHLVEVDHLYYQGGYENHDWMKKYVFHLEEGETALQEAASWEQFSILVDTVTVEEFEKVHGSGGQETEEGVSLLPLQDYDLFYINGDLSIGSAVKILDAGQGTGEEAGTSAPIPCIINQGKVAENSGISTAFAEFVKDTDTDGHYVNTHVYFFKNTFAPASGETGSSQDSLLNLNFHRNFHTVPDGQGEIQGFEEILDYIERENMYREIGENAGKLPPLSTDISQARALEYILNHQYKRQDIRPETVRVLNLQPAKSSGGLSTVQVMDWLGYRMTVEPCCYQKRNETEGLPEYMLDGKWDTIWHSAYNKEGGVQMGHQGNHYIDVILEEPCDDITGLLYTPRNNLNQPGVLEKYKVELFDQNGKSIYSSEEKATDYSGNNQNPNKAQVLEFGKHGGVKKIRLNFVQAKGGHASCAELSVIYGEGAQQVEITTMTTSEFVGHIEDINTKYNIIYLGDDETSLNFFENFRPDDKMLYYHIGGAKIGLNELLGLMDHDYKISDKGTTTNARSGDKDEKTGTIIGSVRGSGNDITKELKDKLVDFAKSGYPVIAAGNIYNENKQVSTELVDNSSYIYDFLNEVKEYENVYREDDLKGNKRITFFANLPKPQIRFTENGTPPSAIKDSSGPSGQYLEGNSLTFEFQIMDEAQASPENARYDCDLYIDLNCDGNYSASEHLEDIVVRRGGQVVNPGADGRYQLELDTVYTVSRTIPEEYIKLIPWKLVVTHTEQGEIRTSQIGYTKRKNNGAENSIRVLQITPVSDCNFDLKETGFQELFQAVKDDFNVQIEMATVQQYEQSYKKDPAYLDQYHMLIVGFCDGEAYTTGNYGTHNFSREGVAGLLDFASTGKSVILAHDNTSSSNLHPSTDPSTYNGDNPWKGWAYYLNQELRAVAGMDRYGITADATSDILKEAWELSAESEEWNTISEHAYDMAYQLNSGKTSSYSETHGFTNGKLNIACSGRGKDTPTTNRVSNVNKGAISEYPYKIDETFSVAATHFQYYQLAMEEDSDRDGSGDIVVWYCLGDKNSAGGSYYDLTPNDVRNNYYIYSYKNIIYTGVGHSPGVTEMEKKLFVNTIIAAYNAQAVNPNLSFVRESAWDSPEEKNVYYNLDHSGQSQELLKDSQEFHLKVTDNNLVGTSFEGTNTKDMKLELYVESENGETVDGIGGESTKVEKISPQVLQGGRPLKPAEDGYVYVNSGNIYDFSLTELGKWLKPNGEYKKNITVYAKISCQYLYYGQLKEASAVAHIQLSKRHLFDMD